MQNLTKRQREIYDYIVSVIKNKGYQPTMREIGAAFGLSSPATAKQHIDALIKKGYLKKDGRDLVPLKD